MSEIARPERAVYHIARNEDGSVLHVGRTDVNQVTTTGQPVFEVDEDAITHLDKLSAFAIQFPELPAEGEHLEAGQKYRYGDGVVEVRRSHIRTHHAPEDVPALFIVVREEATEMEWIANESVMVGDVRWYEGVAYRANKSHVTQTDWTPIATLGDLWLEPLRADDPQPWVQPTGAHDAYQTGDEVTHPDRANTIGEGATTVWVWRSNIDANTTEPGQDGTFHRWWEPLRIAS